MLGWLRGFSLVTDENRGWRLPTPEKEEKAYKQPDHSAGYWLGGRLPNTKHDA